MSNTLCYVLFLVSENSYVSVIPVLICPLPHFLCSMTEVNEVEKTQNVEKPSREEEETEANKEPPSTEAEEKEPEDKVNILI